MDSLGVFLVMFKLSGISVPHNKNTARYKPEILPVPSEVRLPMSMHSGTPANPIVNAGDYVKVCVF